MQFLNPFLNQRAFEHQARILLILGVRRMLIKKLIAIAIPNIIPKQNHPGQRIKIRILKLKTKIKKSGNMNLRNFLEDLHRVS